MVAGKAIAVGKNVIPAAADWPVPCNGTVCGLPVAVSVNVSAACRIPPAAGLKTTETAHVAPAAREEGQVLVEIVKSPGLSPATVTLVMDAAVAPVFMTVVLDAALVLPVLVTGNVNEVGAKVSVVAALTRPVVAHIPASIVTARSAI